MKNISPALMKEVSGLRERIEGQNCHIAMLERQLRALLETTGLRPVSVEAHAPAAVSKRWRATPAARMPAPDRGFWPTPEDSSRPLMPAPGLRAYALKGVPLKVIGISLCGFSREEIEPLVEFVEQHQSQDRSFIPVFLTDTTAANIFRRRGFVFEYLPPPDRVRLRGSKSWADYAAERRRLLARKWGMSDIITFGDVTFGRLKDSVEAETTSAPDLKAASVRWSKAKRASVGNARTSRASKTNSQDRVHSQVR